MHMVFVGSEILAVDGIYEVVVQSVAALCVGIVYNVHLMADVIIFVNAVPLGIVAVVVDDSLIDVLRDLIQVFALTQVLAGIVIQKEDGIL